MGPFSARVVFYYFRACKYNVLVTMLSSPAIAQLVEHLTVENCSNQMVPGSIPGGRIFIVLDATTDSSCGPLGERNQYRASLTASIAQLAEHALRKRTVVGSIPTGGFFVEMIFQ